jgi:acetyl-CoA synthetase
MADFWKIHEREIVMHGDKMNVIESCVDRHALQNPDRIAFVFENNGDRKQYTYLQLEKEINKIANLLNGLNLKKQSRIFIFLPKIEEMYFAVLGAIKAGFVAAPLFEAFQEEGLELRLVKGEANVLITNKELSKRIPRDIKKNAKSLKKIFIVDSSEYKELIKRQSDKFDAVLLDKKETSLMIFTSSTAGTPVAGVMIPHYGLVQQHYTGKLVLDLKEGDKYWCTAHPGWVTGGVYGILAPLSVGCTNYILEEHFEAKRWLNFMKKNKISVLYTAPTALRLLRSIVKKSDFKYLRNLCSVGEALNVSIYDYYKTKGIVINDTYWQTETGAIVIASWPKMRHIRGAIGKAIPGINATIKGGAIAFKPGWPAMMTSIYKHEKMYQSYFKQGLFRTNDVVDLKDGYFFFKQRKDDVIKTSGERVSPIEIESILMKNKEVKEAAVIGVPDEIKGSIIKAFIVLNKCIAGSEDLKEKLALSVKRDYAGHAYPKIIEFIDELPKTNSGKIIRMKLRELENKK